MDKIRVELGKDSYDIHLGYGLWRELSSFIMGRGYSRKTLVVTDEHVGSLYGEETCQTLKRVGLKPKLATIPAGESSKSLQVADNIYTELIEQGMDRKSPIFALGGGVVGDLAGFVAATYLRGVPLIQMPTTLLAQVDSAVGGKVAVNHPLGKNLIGAFYQPEAVFMDMELLSSLPKREIPTGLGEIVKYGVIYDRDFFAYLEEHSEGARSLEPATAMHMVKRSCEIKAAVVSKDEKESGLRRILNFGHTVAHAIEQVTGYTRYNHGEAVSIGMVAAAFISRDLGLVGDAEVTRLQKLMTALDLPQKVTGVATEDLFAVIFRDKKTVNGKVNWVLMNDIGEVTVTSKVPSEVAQKAIAACIA
ncbi:MAG: 3-dehydroquinate synthase [Selenomonadaceae bacterium]|nr:3-dehydroquinate synthase [Selenomonadaceae bacterium]